MINNFQGGVSSNATVGQPYGVIRGTGFKYLNGEKVITPTGYYAAVADQVIGDPNPDWTGGLSAQYQSQPLFGTAYFAANIDGSWRDKMRILPNPAQADSQPGAKPTEYAPESWVVNARASLKEIDLGNDFKGEVGLWGRNLTDYDDPIYSLNQGGLGIASNYMDARSYGVDFVVEF